VSQRFAVGQGAHGGLAGTAVLPGAADVLGDLATVTRPLRLRLRGRGAVLVQPSLKVTQESHPCSVTLQRGVAEEKQQLGVPGNPGVPKTPPGRKELGCGFSILAEGNLIDISVPWVKKLNDQNKTFQRNITRECAVMRSPPPPPHLGVVLGDAGVEGRQRTRGRRQQLRRPRLLPLPPAGTGSSTPSHTRVGRPNGACSTPRHRWDSGGEKPLNQESECRRKKGKTRDTPRVTPFSPRGAIVGSHAAITGLSCRFSLERPSIRRTG